MRPPWVCACPFVYTGDLRSSASICVGSGGTGLVLWLAGTGCRPDGTATGPDEWVLNATASCADAGGSCDLPCSRLHSSRSRLLLPQGTREDRCMRGRRLTPETDACCKPTHVATLQRVVPVLACYSTGHVRATANTCRRRAAKPRLSLSGEAT